MILPINVFGWAAAENHKGRRDDNNKAASQRDQVDRVAEDDGAEKQYEGKLSICQLTAHEASKLYGPAYTSRQSPVQHVAAVLLCS